MTPFGEDRFPPSDNQFVKVMPLVEYQALLSRIAELEKRLDFISELARNWVTEEKWRAKVRILLVYADYNEPLVDHVQLAKDKVNSQPKENEA